MVALIEPMLSVTHSMFHLLPFRLHSACALIRAVLDIALVMPGMACIMLLSCAVRYLRQCGGMLCDQALVATG
jgi:hypothetical protein